MSELPELWEMAPLQAIVPDPQQDIVDGPFGSNLKASEYRDDGVPIIRLQNVSRNRFVEKNTKYISPAKAEELDRHNFRAGDIAITKLGAPLGKAAIIPERLKHGVIVADIVRVRVRDEYADRRFLTYAINSPDVSAALAEDTKGTTRPRVNLGHIRALPIPMAPRMEQTRVAEKLDNVLARVDACRERLDRVPAILKRFREAVLEAAVSGRLTEGWRNSHSSTCDSTSLSHENGPYGADPLPDSWCWVSVERLSIKVADGVHKKPQYVNDGIPFITVRNLTAGPGIDFSETSFVTQADHEEFCRRTHPEPGDLLVSKDGTLGVIRLIEADRPFSIFVSVALIKLNDKRMSRYMRYALESPVVQKQMVGVGTGLQHIHLRDLRQDVVPVPPLDEQSEIVRRVDELFARADALEAKYRATVERVEKLTPSVLAKAFRGELVAQDPKDEPASRLLERIRAQREEGGIRVTRGRAPSKRRAPIKRMTMRATR